MWVAFDEIGKKNHPILWKASIDNAVTVSEGNFFLFPFSSSSVTSGCPDRDET